MINEKSYYSLTKIKEMPFKLAHREYRRCIKCINKNIRNFHQYTVYSIPLVSEKYKNHWNFDIICASVMKKLELDFGIIFFEKPNIITIYHCLKIDKKQEYMAKKYLSNQYNQTLKLKNKFRNHIK